MICKNCSAEFEGKFCPECGAPAEQEAVTEQVEQEIVEQPVAEPVAEPVSEAAEEVTSEPVAEQVEQPAAEPVSESYYYEPASGNGYGEPYVEPKKGHKKVGIIIAVIAVILIAAFCVVSFTDLVFSKEAQFVSTLKNMGSDNEAEFDTIDSKYLETKYSVNINSDNDLVSGVIPEEAADIVNSLGITLKYNYGEDATEGIMSVLENDKELTNASVLMTKDAIFEQLAFSDTVVKLPYGADTNDINEKLEKLKEMLEKELTAALENNEPVKGEYNGGFDLGMDVKTLTVTLSKDETSELINSVIDETFKVLELDRDDYDIPDVEGAEVSVSALYTGAFSFARKSLGVSIVIDDGTEEVEILFFSNKENKAIYGMYSGGQSVVITDNFEIKGDEQSGVINVKTDVTGFDALENISATYTVKNNSGEAKIHFVDGTDSFDIKLSMKNVDGVINTSIVIDYNAEELGSLNIETKACETFDVNIDTDKAIDITKDSFTSDEQEQLANIVADLQDWLSENEDSTVVGFISALFGSQAQDELEAYLADYEISHISSVFNSSERASYVADMDEMIDVQEIGYDGDIVKEITETLYMDVYGYTADQQQAILDVMKDSFSYTESMDDVYVSYELYDDYVIVTLELFNLDNPQNVQTFIAAGLIVGSDENATQLSFSETDSFFLSGGYERVE